MGVPQWGAQHLQAALDCDGMKLQDFSMYAFEFAVLFQPILFATNGVFVIIFVDDACDDEQAAVGSEGNLFVAPFLQAFFGWAITD